MRRFLIHLVAAGLLSAQQSHFFVINEKCNSVRDLQFEDCTIAARIPYPSGVIEKVYRCRSSIVRLTGTWSEHMELGCPVRLEFMLPGSTSYTKAAQRFTNCRNGSGRANHRGYLTQQVKFCCTEADITLEGSWGNEIQGSWFYNLQLGEVYAEPKWISDPTDLIKRSTFQRWCKTPFGFKLCGWVDEPKVDHGKPPEFKRLGVKP